MPDCYADRYLSPIQYRVLSKMARGTLLTYDPDASMRTYMQTRQGSTAERVRVQTFAALRRALYIAPASRGKDVQRYRITERGRDAVKRYEAHVASRLPNTNPT